MSNVGKRIQSIRTAKEMSVADVAAQSGLKTEDIEKIENGDLIPSLTPLIKISRAMGTRMGTFLDDHKEVGPVVVKSEEKKEATRFGNSDKTDNPALNFFSLAHNKAGRNMEPFMINIDPSSSKDYSLSSHEGEEFIFILDGSVEIVYGKEKYILEKGDSIYYDSIVDHHVHTATENNASILAVVYTPA